MPDLNFVIEDILGEDNQVALRWRMRGTTVSGDATPGGVAIETTGTNIFTFDPQGLCLTKCTEWPRDVHGARTAIRHHHRRCDLYSAGFRCEGLIR